MWYDEEVYYIYFGFRKRREREWERSNNDRDIDWGFFKILWILIIIEIN